MNQQNQQRPDYLNMMSAHNYSNIIAPRETEYEHDNRWVWDPQTAENSDYYMSTNANHQLLSVKDSVGTK
jgi:hypothetical protein